MALQLLTAAALGLNIVPGPLRTSFTYSPFDLVPEAMGRDLSEEATKTSLVEMGLVRDVKIPKTTKTVELRSQYGADDVVEWNELGFARDLKVKYTPRSAAAPKPVQARKLSPREELRRRGAVPKRVYSFGEMGDSVSRVLGKPAPEAERAPSLALAHGGGLLVATPSPRRGWWKRRVFSP